MSATRQPRPSPRRKGGMMLSPLRLFHRWLHRRRCRNCWEIHQALKEFEARQKRRRLERLALMAEIRASIPSMPLMEIDPFRLPARSRMSQPQTPSKESSATDSETAVITGSPSPSASHQCTPTLSVTGEPTWVCSRCGLGMGTDMTGFWTRGTMPSQPGSYLGKER